MLPTINITARYFHLQSYINHFYARMVGSNASAPEPYRRTENFGKQQKESHEIAYLF